MFLYILHIDEYVYMCILLHMLCCIFLHIHAYFNNFIHIFHRIFRHILSHQCIFSNICKPRRSNIVHKIGQYIQNCAIKCWCCQHCQYHQVALIFTKYCTVFLHNNKIEKDCTKVLFMYCTTLHKVLRGTQPVRQLQETAPRFFKSSHESGPAGPTARVTGRSP